MFRPLLALLALLPAISMAEEATTVTRAAAVEWTDSVRMTAGVRYGDGFGPLVSLHWGAMLGEPRRLRGENVRGLYVSMGVAATAEAVFRTTSKPDPLVQGKNSEELDASPRLTIGPELRIGRARGDIEERGADFALARPYSTIWFGITPFVGFEETRDAEQTAAFGGRATLGFIDTDSAVGKVISGIQISGDYGQLAATGDTVYGFALGLTRGF